jgi:hypothetical protein
MSLSKLKIAKTVFPNGHEINWGRVNVDEMFRTDRFGNYWFVWAKEFKTKLKIKL